MKRCYLTLVCIFALAPGLMAQSTATQKLLKPNNAATAAVHKPTGTISRLMAVTTATANTGSLQQVDSTHLYYIGDRSWDSVLQTWQMDSAKGFSYSSGSVYPDINYRQTFNAKGQITSFRMESHTNGTVQDQEVVSYTYNGDGLLETERDATAWAGQPWDTLLYVYTYDINNRQAGKETRHWLDMKQEWDTLYLENRHYDSSGLMDSIFYQRWQPSTKSWSVTSKDIYVYSDSGLLITTFSQQPNSGGWETYRQTEYTHDSIGNVIEEHTVLLNAGTLGNNRKVYYEYDAAGNQIKSTEEYFKNNAWQPGLQTFRTYNNQNQLLLEDVKNWFAGQYHDRALTKYYYESYNSSVDGSLPPAESITVYPVPASGQVFFRVQSQSGNNGRLSLISAGGRLIKQTAIPAGTQYSGSLDVSDLPPGNYLLQFFIDGKTTVKRIVVSQ